MLDRASADHVVNPLISACKLHKYHVVVKLLNIAKDDRRTSDSLSRLLAAHCDRMSLITVQLPRIKLDTMIKLGCFKFLFEWRK